MVIVGNRLKRLIKRTKLAPISSFDETCVKLTIGSNIIRLKQCDKTIVYGEQLSADMLDIQSVANEVICLKPFESMLASSVENVNIPMGYVGFLQTKGSLARLMVFLHFSDGQIDSGFNGHITFELFNASKNTIEIPVNSAVGNLYILKTKGKAKPYNGKYGGSVIPTIQK